MDQIVVEGRVAVVVVVVIGQLGGSGSGSGSSSEQLYDSGTHSMLDHTDDEPVATLPYHSLPYHATMLQYLSVSEF